MNEDEHGVWTITLRGGPALWANALMVMSNGVSRSSASHDGPSWQVFQRLKNAEAVYEPKKAEVL